VLTVLKFGRAPILELETEQVRQAFIMAGEITWGAVLAGALGKYGRNQICRLVLEGKLLLDMERPLTTNSIISWATNETLPRLEV